MDIQQSRIIVEVNGDVQFSRFNENGRSGGVQPIPPMMLIQVKKIIDAASQEIKSIQLSSDQSHIEIQLDGKTHYSHTVPIDGSPIGLMTNDVETNKKLKKILENALASIEINLQSDMSKRD